MKSLSKKTRPGKELKNPSNKYRGNTFGINTIPFLHGNKLFEPTEEYTLLTQGLLEAPTVTIYE